MKNKKPLKSTSAQTILVTCGIIWKGQKLLIAQRKPDSFLQPLKWEFPGGKIEFTEDPSKSLQREIKEELDFDIDVGDILGVSSHNYEIDQETTRHILMLAYHCAYKSGEPSAREVHDFRWIEVEQLGEFDFAAADLCIVDKLQKLYLRPSSSVPTTEEGKSVLTDESCSVGELKRMVNRFVGERDWHQFHSPKNLSMSISIEAAELMEHFQWVTVEESRFISLDQEQFEQVGQEIADIVMYSLSLCNMLNIDLSEAISRKDKINRQKYPLEEYWGKYTT